MTQRPGKLLPLSIIYAAVAAVALTQALMLWGSSFEVGSLLSWGIVLLAVATVTWVYNASSWLAVGVPGLLIASAAQAWLLGGAVASSWSPILLLSALPPLAVLITLPWLLGRDVRFLFLNQDKRWWLVSRRKPLRLGMRIVIQGGGELVARTFDLSESGAFVSLQGAIDKGATVRQLSVRSECYIRLNLNQFRYLQCKAEIVRHAPSRGAYPTGFGIRFVGLNRRQKRYLSDYLRAA